MKKMNQTLGVLALSCALVACGGNQKKAESQPEEATVATLSYSSSLKAPETDSLKLPIDKDGYITALGHRRRMHQVQWLWRR